MAGWDAIPGETPIDISHLSDPRPPSGLRCKICGCFTAAKSKFLQESCPIGKWPA
jgi:hypothetical protein